MQLHCVHCRLDVSINYFSFGQFNSNLEIPKITLNNSNCWTLFRALLYIRTHCLIHAGFKAT